MAKDKSFNTLFINSWKYTDACANSNGTFRYSNFPKGCKSCFGNRVFIEGYVMLPSVEIEC